MKEYVKPELYCESFELSQHIAACGIDVNSSNDTVCNPNTIGATLDPDFWGENTNVFNAGSCVMDVNTIDVYCYTSGTTEAGRLFNS